jgi:hypothetical protein
MGRGARVETPVLLHAIGTLSLRRHSAGRLRRRNRSVRRRRPIEGTLLHIGPAAPRSHRACPVHRSRPAVEMIGPAFDACREMEYLLSGAGELTGRRSLAQSVGDLPVMLRAGYTSPHHMRQNASAHRMTSAAVEMMIPSAAFARSRRVGSRASWPMTNCRSPSIAAKSFAPHRPGAM